MGEFVVKASPDVDLYLIWSTITDCPYYVGTREEIREHLWDEYRSEHPHSTPQPGYSPDDRMARADEHGTSAQAPAGMYGWDDEAFSIREVVPDDGHWYELPRVNLVAYARALLDEDEPAAHALLRRVESLQGCAEDG